MTHPAALESSQPPNEPLVLQAEQRRCEALLRGDTDALQALMSPGLVYGHSTGAYDSRDSYLHKLRSGALRYRALTLTPSQVHCGPHAAVVTGHMEAVIVKDGQEKTVRSLYMTVWWPSDGQWLLQAHQGTPLPAQA